MIYILVASNFSMAGLAFARGKNKAGAAALAVGGAIFFNALMTDYELGVFRKWSCKTHAILDYSVAAASSVLPMMLAVDSTMDRAYLHGQSGAETLLAGLTDFDDVTGSEREQKRWNRRYPGRVA